jgi:16S rRNA (cytosine967-C5)-methyltransferase
MMAMLTRRGASAREAALDMLLRVEREDAYSNIELNRTLGSAGLSRADAALATELVYGTIQRRLTLDYWLARFVARGLDKLQPWVLMLLRMSLYQLVYLDRIPPHAAVGEAVKIAKKRGHPGVVSLVNGVLRSLAGCRGELELPDDPDPVRRLSLKHSFPEWMAARWIETYGEETAEAVMAALNERPRACIRVNRLRGGRRSVLERLKAEGFDAKPSLLSPAGIVIRRGGNLADTDGYRNGEWTVQDEAAMLVAEACDPEPGMLVLDCCAAPGGKSTHLAELMGDVGVVLANDIHPHKERLIVEQAERLGLSSVRTSVCDAAELPRRIGAESMDVVLLDAPCSGFGVIRRKPEIRWTKQPADIDEIAAVQHRLLAAAAAIVKPGGLLVYSTCTFEPRENEEQIARFLASHAEFAPDPDWPQSMLDGFLAAGLSGPSPATGSVTLLPHVAGTDGFFIARLRKRG